MNKVMPESIEFKLQDIREHISKLETLVRIYYFYMNKSYEFEKGDDYNICNLICEYIKKLRKDYIIITDYFKL